MWTYVNLCESIDILYLFFAPWKNSMFATDSPQCPHVSRGMSMSGLNKSTLKHKAGRRDGGTQFKRFLAIAPFQHVEKNRTALPQVQYRKNIEQLSRIQVISRDLKRFKCLLASGHLLVFKNGLRKMRERPGLGGLWWPMVTYGGLWCPMALRHWNRWWCSSSPICSTYVPPMFHPGTVGQFDTVQSMFILTISQEFRMFTSFFWHFSHNILITTSSKEPIRLWSSRGRGVEEPSFTKPQPKVTPRSRRSRISCQKSSVYRHNIVYMYTYIYMYHMIYL